jgi:hypothetical protein
MLFMLRFSVASAVGTAFLASVLFFSPLSPVGLPKSENILPLHSETQEDSTTTTNVAEKSEDYTPYNVDMSPFHSESSTDKSAESATGSSGKRGTASTQRATPERGARSVERKRPERQIQPKTAPAEYTLTAANIVEAPITPAPPEASETGFKSDRAEGVQQRRAADPDLSARYTQIWTVGLKDDTGSSW